jgi:predicted porin
MKARSFCASALALSAVAAANAQSSVTLYGVIDASGAVFERTKAGTDRLYRLNTDTGSSSRLGFKGSEDLGDGLSAIFNLEAPLDASKGVVGGGASSGAANPTVATTQAFFRRNAYVGLNGRFGKITIGRNYTAGILGQALNVSALPAGINTGFATAVAAQGIGNDFWNSNQIRYDSPTFGGFDFIGAVSAGEQGGGGNKAGSTFGGMLRYQNGPATIVANYQRDYDTAPTGNSLHWYMLSGSYKVGALRLTAGYDAVKNDAGRTAISPGGISTVSGPSCPSTPSPATAPQPCPYVGWTDSKMWTVGAAYNVTPLFVLAGQYYAIKETFGGTTSKQAVVNAQYYLSKRTSLYALYSNTDSKNLGLGALWGNGNFSGATNIAVANAKNNALAMGIQHVF